MIQDIIIKSMADSSICLKIQYNIAPLTTLVCAEGVEELKLKDLDSMDIPLYC